MVRSNITFIFVDFELKLLPVPSLYRYMSRENVCNASKHGIFFLFKFFISNTWFGLPRVDRKFLRAIRSTFLTGLRVILAWCGDSVCINKITQAQIYNAFLINLHILYAPWIGMYAFYYNDGIFPSWYFRWCHKEYRAKYIVTSNISMSRRWKCQTRIRRLFTDENDGTS